MSISSLVKEFELPAGAKYVDKYFLRNSSSVIIHIRQVHRVYEMSQLEYDAIRDVSPKYVERMRDFCQRAAAAQDLDLLHRVQNDIYHIMDSLIARYGINKVFVEAVDDFLADSYNRFPEIMRDTNENVHLRLLHEGKIQIRGAETSESNIKGCIYGQLGDIYSRETMDDRERIGINKISEEGDLMSVIIYGGLHDFLPDVKKWNTEEKNRFSLIVVTPESYEEDRTFFDRIYYKYR